MLHSITNATRDVTMNYIILGKCVKFLFSNFLFKAVNKRKLVEYSVWLVYALASKIIK